MSQALSAGLGVLAIIIVLMFGYYIGRIIKHAKNNNTHTDKPEAKSIADMEDIEIDELDDITED